MIGIIGGSGLTQLDDLDAVRRRPVITPYGEPSGPLTFGSIQGHALVFLARHGEGHTIPPHEINYRANMWALREQSVEGVVSIASVGGIRPDLEPGVIVVPHQLIDYTSGRKSTYFDGGGAVVHIDFTEPYSRELRDRILIAARTCQEAVADGAVYATTQGPRLETAAEIDRIERDGGAIVGMTGMPEAALARELAIPYACMALVVNFAAGRGNSRRQVSLDGIEEVLRDGMIRVRRILDALVAR